MDPPQLRPRSPTRYSSPTSPISLKPLQLLNACRALSVDLEASSPAPCCRRSLPKAAEGTRSRAGNTARLPRLLFAKDCVTRRCPAVPQHLHLPPLAHPAGRWHPHSSPARPGHGPAPLLLRGGERLHPLADVARHRGAPSAPQPPGTLPWGHLGSPPPLLPTQPGRGGQHGGGCWVWGGGSRGSRARTW